MEISRPKRRTVGRAASLVALILAAIPVQTADAAPARRTLDEANGRVRGAGDSGIRLKKLEAFKRQLSALCALSPLTVKGATAALNTTLGLQQQLTDIQTEWPLQPTDLMSGGRAIQISSNVRIEIALEPALKLTFEELASMLADVPYAWELQHSHHGDLDGFNTKVSAVDHVFVVPAGNVSVRIPYDVSREDREHFMKAEKAAEEFALGTGPGRTTLVGTLTVTSIPRLKVTPRRTLRERRLAETPRGQSHSAEQQEPSTKPKATRRGP